MRNVLLITILLVSSFGFCQQTKKLNVDSLKLELAKFLVRKNQLSNLEEFSVKNRGLYFGGIHKNKLDEELKNGIYVFNNNSTHSYSFFAIIDDNSFRILDISTFEGLKESIKDFLIFADKQNYCNQITNDYISRFLNVHYNINRNPRNRLNRNCEYDLKHTKSTFDINSLKNKLAEFLLERKELENMEFYLNYPDFLMVEKFDIFYGIKEDQKMDCGIYSFGLLNQVEETKFHYLILNEDWIETFDNDNIESLSNGINKILDFAENHKYCHLRTRQIIQELIERQNLKSCFDNPTFDLP